MLLIDSIPTLTDVVIIDFTQINLVLWVTSFHGVIVNGGGSNKRKMLSWLTPSGCIFPFCCKGFWLLAPTNERFFHWCANMVWSGPSGPFLTILCTFYKSKVSIALQKVHATSILRCIIIIDESFFKLIVLFSFPSIFLYDTFLQLVGALEHDLF